ncbi:hypothetical protein AAE02nite_44720 [Adhaeribacter aerolatus]|uniref:FAD-binding PCMH-type domain-containing protein n=1 Tax=Adhaeribacter aerolatus TaxID=670289 RepID=A0A512B4D0_9BACT|nr:FAD-linked oxidase [Adhaeribacter aerolatus]GEO06808.1 hypothetical protein AAE02nite_44720 [Adhaeribacter aerolatus]
MELPDGVKLLKLNQDKFINAHANFTQKLRKDASFELSVSDPLFKQKYPTFKEKYNKTTQNIQWLIKHAIANNTRIRAMGSGWSLSKVAVSEDGIINTKKLTLKAELSASQVSEAFLQQGGDPTDLLFAQCGNEIIRINDLLEKERQPAKALRVSGGSNGQTIVGAFSTGTHGAAFRTGSLCDCVVGMHLIVGPDRHVWLERASYPVTSAAFTNWMGAEVIRDDELFNAALVSFGSFGFIHSVLIEVEPKYLLVQQLLKIPYNAALVNAIKFNDFSGLAARLNFPPEQLYHFELAINPHNFKQDGKTEEVYLRVMYKQRYHTNYTPFDHNAKGKFTYGDDVLGLIQTALDVVEKIPGNKIDLKLIPNTVNALFKVAYDRPATATGTIGETFRNTIFRGKLFSAGFAFDQKDIPDVIQLFLRLNKQTPFCGVMAFRFVKGTKATLGFCKFEHSCVLELDGADAKLNHQFTEAFARQLETENIKYSVHWGKINNFLTRERVRKIYGEAAIQSWLQCRRRLLNDKTWAVFNNQFLELCGLDKYEEVMV